MMPNRYSKVLRAWIYRFLVLRDGAKCHWCGKIPAALKGLSAAILLLKVSPELEIDHVDGNKKNDDPSNLVLACKTCNVTRGNQMRPSPSDCVERERENSYKVKSVLKQVVNYSNADTPATTQLNYFYETDYKTYVINRVFKESTVAKEDLIFAGSQHVGCSVQAARNYIGQLLSSAGPLREDPDMLMGKFVTWKEGVNPANYLTKEMRSL
jgi:hypothetical protein